MYECCPDNLDAALLPPRATRFWVRATRVYAKGTTGRDDSKQCCGDVFGVAESTAAMGSSAPLPQRH
ncbi:MAG: hypothetical protein JRH20_27975 [Deltaproteobacteria bacterium]|nr:hypothetical protein [Deltaproteobacteria bacterium]